MVIPLKYTVGSTRYKQMIVDGLETWNILSGPFSE